MSGTSTQPNCVDRARLPEEVTPHPERWMGVMQPGIHEGLEVGKW